MVIGGEERNEADNNTGYNLKRTLAVQPEKSALNLFRLRGIRRLSFQSLRAPNRKQPV